MNALDYLLKANLYGLLFAGSYWLLLRRHTFFGLNRAYLLASSILLLVLPFVSLPTQTVETLPIDVPVGLITLPATGGGRMHPPIETTSGATQPDWVQIGLIVYGLIALFFLLRFSVQVGRLLRLIRQSPQQQNETYVLVQPNDQTIPTFSFFQYVVLNPADTHNDLILRHELVHVWQYHSVDVVIMGILRAICWACPALRLVDQLLRQVHEFLADKPTSRPTEYAQFLVDYSFGTHPGLSGSEGLKNSFFNPSLLKQRIIMLHRKATNRWALGKYALVLPLTFALLAMTTEREDITGIVNQATNETITVSGRVTNSVDGKPLSGAIVLVVGTGKGTPTNAKGNYQLQQVPREAMLSISFTGFTTQVVHVNGRTVIQAGLVPTNPNELPTMGATAIYKAIKPNPKMPIRTPPSSETINGKVYTAVEESAVFPTGIPGLMQYVAHALRYPVKARTKGVQGSVLVQFIVLPNGAIGAATIKKGIGSGCDEEALRIVRQMPHWIPAKQNGKTIASLFVLPVQFALEQNEDKRTGRIDAEIVHPMESPIGEFPTIRDVNYPNQPRLTTVKVPARQLILATTPQFGSGLKIDTNVTIRGRGPLGELGGKPLYIIDGVEVSRDDSKNILTPNNIESITVLKNSAAAAYGLKSKYGVLLINGSSIIR